jgi:hypothetical protein
MAQATWGLNTVFHTVEMYFRNKSSKCRGNMITLTELSAMSTVYTGTSLLFKFTIRITEKKEGVEIILTFSIIKCHMLWNVTMYLTLLTPWVSLFLFCRSYWECKTPYIISRKENQCDIEAMEVSAVTVPGRVGEMGGWETTSTEKKVQASHCACSWGCLGLWVCCVPPVGPAGTVQGDLCLGSQRNPSLCLLHSNTWLCPQLSGC